MQARYAHGRGFTLYGNKPGIAGEGACTMDEPAALYITDPDTFRTRSDLSSVHIPLGELPLAQ
ncbi:MAG: hypothetical protein IPI05_05345 [Flavobacteriales bacterium]|nr:hypothetical protein [Flavobacteriales bacterium]